MIGSVMLVTTCPECQTTFRISEEILRKANGQVRCGRCAHIFDARRALDEEPETEVRRLEVTAGVGEPARPDAGTKAADTAGADTTIDAGTASPTAGADEDESEADTRRQPRWFIQDTPPEAAVRTGAAAEPAPTGTAPDNAGAASAPEAGPVSDTEAWADTAAAPDGALAVPDWLPPAREPVERRAWPWTAGVVLLALALTGQLVHLFRADIAALPAIGSALVGFYSWFGVELVPRVDLTQYDMLDLTGAAEPATDEQGSLVIETRVRNKGPKVQPFPHIFVRLLDRWQETIAGRYFSPAEYLVTSVGDTSHMSVGRIVDAQFVIVDPGPSATGFELEFCMPAGEAFHCESDEVHN